MPPAPAETAYSDRFYLYSTPDRVSPACLSGSLSHQGQQWAKLILGTFRDKHRVCWARRHHRPLFDHGPDLPNRRQRKVLEALPVHALPQPGPCALAVVGEVIRKLEAAVTLSRPKRQDQIYFRSVWGNILEENAIVVRPRRSHRCERAGLLGRDKRSRRHGRLSQPELPVPNSFRPGGSPSPGRERPALPGTGATRDTSSGATA